MGVHFQDINFKLCVIQELMYNQSLLEPKFEIYEFVKSYTDRKIDIDKEGYNIIPEALVYFEKIEIPAGLLMNVSKIYQDGGNDIYMQICPFWSGEDDKFNIKKTEDTSLLPNLKRMVIFYEEDETILDELKEKNIDAEYL